MKKRLLTVMALVLMMVLLVPANAFAWTADNGDGTFSNPLMFGDYPDNDVIRVGDTYYMSSTSMHLFPACPVMSSKDLVNWKYESYALSEEEALRLANNDDGLTLQNGRSVYDMGPWATSLRYSEKLKKFYLLVNMQDGVDAEYAILCVADKASGPWKAYRLDNPTGVIKGLYDPGLLFDKDPVTGEENGDIWVVHGQGRLYVSKLNVVDEKTGELAIDEKERNIEIYNYTGGGFNEGSHAYKFGDTYYIISTPTWNGTPSKKSIAIQTKNLTEGPYVVKDIMRSFMNFGSNGIHQGGIVDVPLEDGSSEWWSVIFQDRNKLGRVPTLQPVYWEKDQDGYNWPMMGVQGKNGDQAVVTMEKPHTGAVTEPTPPADSDEFKDTTLGLHWQWNHVSDHTKWSLTERPGYMRLYTASVTNNLTRAQNTLRQRVVGPESSATIKLDISQMADGDIAGLSVIQRDSNYIGVTLEGEEKRLVVKDKEQEQISASIPADTETIWFRASMPRFEYRVEFFYSLDGKSFTQLGGKYDMRYGNYVGMGFGAFNFATKALGGYVDMDYFRMDMPDDHGNYHVLNEKVEAERYDVQSYDVTLGEPSREYNPLTKWTADYVYTNALENWGTGYDLALGNLRDGNWVQYNQIDFKDGADWFNIRVSGTADGGKIEIRKNNADGELLAVVDVPNTGSLESYENVIVPLKAASPKGIQKICLVYKDGTDSSCQFNWFMFGAGEKPAAPAVPQGLKAKGQENGQIQFSWTEVPGITYDLQLGDRTISNIHSPFVETGLAEGFVFKACVRAKNYGGYSAWSEGTKAATAGNPYIIPQSSISIPKFSSQEAGGEGAKSGYISAILDGDTSTFWHSAWSSGNARPPHWFILDLGKDYKINRITMLPRQGSGDKPNGLFKKVTLSYSTAGTEDADFTVLADQKQLPEGIAETSFDFEEVTARYVKVYVNESHNDFASLAEINVYRSEADDTAPGAPQNLTAELTGKGADTAVVLNWEKAEDAESGISCYSIYRNDQFLDVTTALKYTDTTAEAGKTYQYKVVASNGAGVDGQAASCEITVSVEENFDFALVPASGFYKGATTATVVTESTSLTFYYTLDGSEPTDKSQVYAGGISLPYGVTRLKVAAYYNGKKAGETAQEDYMVNKGENVALNATASSEHDAHWDVWPLPDSVDGDIDTWWNGDLARKDWNYEIDFGKTVSFDSLYIAEYVQKTQTRNITGFELEYFDGTEWKTADTYQADELGTSQVQWLNDVTAQTEVSQLGTSFARVTGSKVRFHFTGSRQLGLREVQFYDNTTDVQAVEGVSLDKETMALKAGENGQLTATVTPENAANKKVTWSTSDAAVAAVDENGLVAALAEGTAIITVTTEDGNHTASCEVTVEKAEEPVVPVTGVSLDKETMTLKAGENGQLTATVEPADAANQKVIWSTSDESVAAVDENGLVTALAAGKATVTVTTEDGNYTASCEVTVEKQAEDKPDRAVLQSAVKAAKAKDLSGYTAESADAYRKALAEAEKVLAKADATQAEIDGAVKALQAAEEGLKVQTAPPVDNGKQDLAVGKVYDSGSFSYKVTSLTKLTAEVVGLKKKSATSVKIYNTVTLGGKTFQVTSVAPSVFKNNKKIKSAVIGKNVTAIGSSAFAGCTKLTKVTIGANVRKIGKNAFYGCKKLKSVTVKTKKLTKKTVGSKAFKGIHAKAVVRVPKAKAKSYKSLFKGKGMAKTVKIK